MVGILEAIEQSKISAIDVAKIPGLKHKEAIVFQRTVEGSELPYGIMKMADNIAMVDDVEGLTRERVFGHWFCDARNMKGVADMLYLSAIELYGMWIEAAPTGFVKEEPRASPNFKQVA